MTKISITIGIKKRFQKKSTKSQTILPISIYPLTTARTKKGKRGKREKREKRRVSIRKREKREKRGKRKKERGFPASLQGTPSLKKAATYSPALRCSTIGAPGLNFSVRDG
ncbi:MAG: hypothetical protein PUC18_11150, partial [Prevotellaceae bacterium]|nr:hypothetical protein [Prevotellaceae bacterium]